MSNGCVGYIGELCVSVSNGALVVCAVVGLARGLAVLFDEERGRLIGGIREREHVFRRGMWNG